MCFWGYIPLVGDSDTAAGQLQCGMHALTYKNYPAAIKWLTRTANHGATNDAVAAAIYSNPNLPPETYDTSKDAIYAAMTLGGVYKNGDGVPPDFAKAYCWYDIAAAIHGTAIDKLTATRSFPETNQVELSWRDNVAKKMTPEQLAAGRECSIQWQKNR
jgi:TPR repeat protein